MHHVKLKKIEMWLFIIKLVGVWIYEEKRANIKRI